MILIIIISLTEAGKQNVIISKIQKKIKFKLNQQKEK